MTPTSAINGGEEMGPTEGLCWALMQLGGQLMIVTDHMARSLEEGGATDGERFDHVLARLLTDTWEKGGDRPSRRDLATATRIVKWASAVVAEEIVLIPHDLKLDPSDDCLDRLPPQPSMLEFEPRPPVKHRRRPG